MSDEPRRNRNKTVFQESPLSGMKRQEAGNRQRGGGGSVDWGDEDGGGGGDAGFDPWNQPSEPAPPAPPQRSPGYAPNREQARVAGVAPSKLAEDDVPLPSTPLAVRNIMLNEARPILALFSGLQAGRVDAKLPKLNREAKAAIRDFERAILPHYPDEKMRYAAKYALCVTIDDLAQNLPNRENDGIQWARRSLASEHFRDRSGGTRFWRIVDDILADPANNRDLIELCHACLAAGFMGEYRGRPGLREIMTRLYSAMEHPRSLSQLELVREWRGEDAPAGKPAFWSIVMLAAAGAGAVLLLIYLILRLVLASTGAASSDALEELVPDDRLTMSREAVAPPQTQGEQASRLEQFLAPEIQQGLVVIDQDSETVRIRTTYGQLFQSGSDQLEPGREALFGRIADALQEEPGSILVEGHSDSDRISPSFRFPDNKALSEARANVVGYLISQRLSDPSRVTIIGHGADRPIASNATPEGKALNRRVEIIIPRAR